MSTDRLDERSPQLQKIEGGYQPLPTALPESSEPLHIRQNISARTFSLNSAMTVGRLILTTLVALLLPGYLTHKLPVKTFSAWVLILQMSAYVGYLDFGIQAGVSKFVAEYETRGDAAGANQRASAGLAIMLAVSMLGTALTLILAWQVPRLFGEMPPTLYHDVRLSLVLVGISLSFGLVCSVTSAIFLGLQRYAVPTLLMLGNRLLFTIAVMTAVAMHASLALMGAAVALVNVLTGLAQVVAWKRLASHIRLSLAGLEGRVVRQMISYCAVLAVWTVGMLCVSGLDVTIVGRYDFAHTASYSIAVLPTNFLIAIVGAALGPLLPAASAHNAASSPLAMGHLLERVTRYTVLLLGLIGLPLLLGGYWALRVWVGPDYALHTVGYLHLLVVANMIRNIGLPYSTMLVATGRQKTAIAGATAEAVVNLCSSIYLAHRMGAVGVALGTLLGSVVSIAMHFAVSMYYARDTFAISRTVLFFSGILRPAVMTVPSLLCVRLWWTDGPPALGAGAWVGWAATTLLLGWFGGLRAGERTRLLALFKTRAGLGRPRAAVS